MAAASLAFATNLSDRMLIPQGNPVEESNNSSQEVTDSAEIPQTEEIVPEEPQVDFRAELETIKSEMKNTIKDEISGLRKTIEKALDEEED